MGRPEGAALIKRLAAKSDVLIENFKVGGLARFGLGYDDLRTDLPRLIYCSITGFGRPDQHDRRSRRAPGQGSDCRQ
jgi:crotonobetainyl-CoA:carnitine CoA-transferase CaiB-like acyl-CoA transferase